MHASAPDVTKASGSETVAYEGTDEPDMNFGPGSNGWNLRIAITGIVYTSWISVRIYRGQASSIPEDQIRWFAWVSCW